jgi:hypothetical protein
VTSRPRLPRRKALTFIVGLKCSEGLVICADRLESDGVTNRYRQKLECVNVGSEWGVCWAGSGSAYAVDKFSDQLKRSLGNDSYNRAAIEEKAEVCLEFVRQSYSANEQISIVLGPFGSPIEKQGTPPVIGLPEFHLYRGSSDSSCLSPEKEYCCAGMDVTLAGFTLANTYHRFMPVSHGKRLGIFVTSLMKKYADRVGGPTDVFFYLLGAQSWTPMIDREVSETERDFHPISLEESVSKWWLHNPKNCDLNELTQTALLKRMALNGERTSEADKIRGPRKK